MPVADLLSLQQALQGFAVKCYPSEVDYVNDIMASCLEMLEKTAKPLSDSSLECVREMLVAPVRNYSSVLTLLQLEDSFPQLMQHLPLEMRKEVAVEVLRMVLKKHQPTRCVVGQTTAVKWPNTPFFLH